MHTRAEDGQRAAGRGQEARADLQRVALFLDHLCELAPRGGGARLLRHCRLQELAPAASPANGSKQAHVVGRLLFSQGRRARGGTQVCAFFESTRNRTSFGLCVQETV